MRFLGATSVAWVSYVLSPGADNQNPAEGSANARRPAPIKSKAQADDGGNAIASRSIAAAPTAVAIRSKTQANDGGEAILSRPQTSASPSSAAVLRISRARSTAAPPKAALRVGASETPASDNGPSDDGSSNDGSSAHGPSNNKSPDAPSSAIRIGHQNSRWEIYIFCFFTAHKTASAANRQPSGRGAMRDALQLPERCATMDRLTACSFKN